jgi:hypothetical protein
MLGMLLLGAGGCVAQRSTVATWTEGESVHRVNEQTELGTPSAASLDWADATLTIQLAQQRTARFDIEKRANRYQLVRELRGENDFAFFPHLFPASVLLITPVMWYPLIMGPFDVQSENGADAEAALKAIREGRTTVEGKVLHGYWTIVPVHQGCEYHREPDGVESQRERAEPEVSTVGAANAPIRLVDQGTKREFAQTSDSAGVARFTFASDLRQLLALRPTAYRVQVQWEDRWVKLGETELTEAHIAQALKAFSGRRMAHSGIPDAPPQAQVECSGPKQVSRGEPVELMVTVKNTGRGECYKLWAAVESEIAELNGQKLEYGKVDPGETVLLPIRATLRRDQPTGPAQIRLKWSELNGYAPDPTTLTVVVGR